MRLWLRNSGLRPSDSLATTAHFFSWNYINAPDVLLIPCTLILFLNTSYSYKYYVLIRIHNSEQRCPSVGGAVADSAGTQYFVGVIEQIVHFQVTAPVFAEFVTQVQV